MIREVRYQVRRLKDAVAAFAARHRDAKKNLERIDALEHEICGLLSRIEWYERDTEYEDA